MSDPKPASESVERRVRCPACQQWCVYSTRNPYRPFCSAACKGLDFGAWASESFRVPQDTPTDGEFGDPKLH